MCPGCLCRSGSLSSLIQDILGRFALTMQRILVPGQLHEGYVLRIWSGQRLFHPAFFRMTLSDFLSFAMLSKFIAMCLMMAKFFGA